MNIFKGTLLKVPSYLARSPYANPSRKVKEGPKAVNTYALMRVLEVIDDAWVVLFFIHNKRRAIVLPEKHALVDILKRIEDKTISVVDEDPYFPFDLLSLAPKQQTPKQQAIAANNESIFQNRIAIVKEVLELGGLDIYDEHTYKKITKLVAVDSGKENSYPVRRLMSAYWRGGSVLAALRVDRSNLGRTKNYKKTPSKYRMTDLDKKRIKQHAIDNADSNETLEVIHLRFLQRYYSEGTEICSETGREKIRLLPTGEYPPFANFNKWYFKLRDLEAVLRKHLGDKKFEKTLRPLTGSSIARTAGPLARVEFDFTISSVTLVSVNNRAQILGKPVIGRAWDVYTGACLGVIVSLENSSELLMRMLFRNVISDKVAYCAKYGVTIGLEEWPMHHIPRNVICDRGEGLGEIGTQFAERFDLTWKNLPTGRPDLKGTVESGFARDERKSKSLPGWEPQYWNRGDDIPEEGSCLTLDEYTAIVIEYTLEQLNESNPARYVPPAALRPGKKPPSPLELWTIGLEKGFGLPRCETNQQIIDLKVLPQVEVDITGSGIIFEHLYYDHPDLRAELIRARNSGQTTAIILYHPHHARTIWLRLSKNTTDVLACELVDISSKFAEASFAEAKLIINEEKYQSDDEKRLLLQKRLNAKVTQDARVEKARLATLAAKKAQGLGSKDYLGKDIRKHRADEKLKNRQDNKYLPDSAESDSSKIVKFPCDDQSNPDKTKDILNQDDAPAELNPDFSHFLTNFKKKR